MRFVIRTDASVLIGSGHVMRCLTLAAGLHEQGAEVLFVCRDFPGNLNDLIAAEGFDICRLPATDKQGSSLDWNRHAAWLGVHWYQDAEETLACLKEQPFSFDWLIVDHYALDNNWESTFRHLVDKIMVIDDLADRIHDCDLLLDQNLGRKTGNYENFVPENCKLLIGLKYALLRPEFAGLRQYSLSRRVAPRLNRLLVSMGGVDKDNITSQVLDVLKECSLPANCTITVVMGPHAPWLDKVQEKSNQMRFVTEVISNVRNMAMLMADSDLAIGGAGSTSWERCTLGLPSIIMLLAENQRDVARKLSEVQASILLDENDMRTSLIEAVIHTACNPKNMRTISLCAANLLDGYGRQRVIQQVLEEI